MTKKAYLTLAAAQYEQLTRIGQEPDFSTFEEQRGLLCGNGPIEAARRTLLQARLKRRGQRWSETGLDRPVKLRTALHSSQQQLVMDLFKKATE